MDIDLLALPSELLHTFSAIPILETTSQFYSRLETQLGVPQGVPVRYLYSMPPTGLKPVPRDDQLISLFAVNWKIYMVKPCSHPR